MVLDDVVIEPVSEPTPDPKRRRSNTPNSSQSSPDPPEALYPLRLLRPSLSYYFCN